MTIQTKPSITDYFESMEIEACTSKSDFWKHVTAVNPILTEELAPLFSRTKQGNLYAVKNQSLPFSLAVESWTLSFHKAFLNWITQQKQFKPKRILEIGCDNGLLTCLYATLYPDAEVVGIDRGNAGIRCAQQLTRKLGLTNVSFFQNEFMELPDHFLTHSFDLIISVRTFHEIMGPVLISRYWSLPEYLKGNPTYGDRAYMQIVDDLLTEEGVYFSCERLENPADLGKWANLLRDANLHVQWHESGLIDYHEFGVKKRSPVIIAAKKETGLDTLDGMEQLYTKNSLLVLENRSFYRGAKGEYAFHRLGEKKLLSGQYLHVTNHWYEFRCELWETNKFLLVYCYGNMGHRHLEILSAGAYSEGNILLNQLMEPYIHLGPIVHYKKLEERPR
ncbi:methyltransferase domain-containing protein [Neobacillus dielmonensis]|uniref:methyltransferase domain-containing protein n=1 Tax=Neobacillus dielmonensis TaxID=1347369 RepID=UPI0005AB7B3E|nr:methyltransferase domain-containing protein [Neobacillus dielmonensis]